MTTSTVVDRDSLIAEAPTTTAQSNQPERTAAWHEAYPAPRSLEHLKHISVQEVAQWYADPNQQPGKDFVVVDVRRADCETLIPGAINLPAQSLPAALSSLLPLLQGIPRIAFHCNSSRGRGPRAAGWVADALEAASYDVHEQVLVLEGGIVAWEAAYGRGSAEDRGKPWDGLSLATLVI